MLKIIVLVGIPGSGKSSWAKTEVSKEPLNWCRINNDDIRSMVNGSVYSSGYEKLITETRLFLIETALKKDKNVIVDNLNLNPRHWEDALSIAKKINKPIQVFEKHFYIDLLEAIERDSKREGTAKVGEKVIRHWWNESGKEQFKFYHPKNEVFLKRDKVAERIVKPLEQNISLPKAIVCDLDGSIADISHRSPYASNCIDDKPVEHVVNLCNLFYKDGYKIFFFSGREDKNKEMTAEWLDKHFGGTYQLFMRETGNKEDDVALKSRLFETHIKDQYNLQAWIDDRAKVCDWVYSNGLPIFRVSDPLSSF